MIGHRRIKTSAVRRTGRKNKGGWINDERGLSGWGFGCCVAARMIWIDGDSRSQLRRNGRSGVEVQGILNDWVYMIRLLCEILRDRIVPLATSHLIIIIIK